MPRGAYKDDLEAAHQRIRNLEQDNQALEAKLAGAPVQAPDGKSNSLSLIRVVFITVVLLILAFTVGLPTIGSLGVFRGLAVTAGVLILLAIPVALILRLIHTCKPNEALVVSGRQHRGADGVVRGYRVVRAGRVIQLPFLEQMDRLDLGLQRFDFKITGAYTKGGIPADVEGTSAVRVHGGVQIHNAVERFLGQDPEAMVRVARETLEGNLRTVMGICTFEELREDRLKVAAMAGEEISDDFEKLGLTLELLELQSVSSPALRS